MTSDPAATRPDSAERESAARDTAARESAARDTAARESAEGWSDPLYRPRTELPAQARVERFGTVEAAMTITDTDPHTVEASYLPDRAISLVVTDDVGPAALEAVLAGFRTLATELADRPTTASITLPSRDVDRCRVARAAGFFPSAVLAVAARPAVAPGTPDGVTIRDASVADATAVADLWCEQTDFEACVGTLRTSERIRAAIRASVPLTVPRDGEALLAESDGRVVGLLLAQSVEGSLWATGRLVPSPAAYLSVASTTAGARGRGVGRALVGALHDRYRRAGIVASVLHYGPYNPLSAPFWSQCGYRPLLTTHSSVVA